MYIPKHHEESDQKVLHELIRAHPLGTWVTISNDEPLINHIPFLLDANRGDHGTLIAHVARANPIWQSFSTQVNSVIVFHGPNTYITPSWYASKETNGKVVPTWNYAVVHAHGMPKAIEDKDWLLRHVAQLTDTHEAKHALRWKLTDAPTDYAERLLQSIVGIEIPIARLIGKWKVSQNRSDADKRGVVAGLMTQNDDASVEMAALVKQHIETK